jgi:hypothetical protein
MSRFQLAQLNIGVIRGPIDSPVMAEFMANIDRINLLAEQSPGFVWRLQTEEGNATGIKPYGVDIGDNTIVNMSVWEDVASLNHYVYKSAHVEILRRRKEWFERMQEQHMVLWWVAHGHRPSVEEALERLEHLRAHGPGEHAFTFRHNFPAPDAPAESSAPVPGDICPAV